MSWRGVELCLRRWRQDVDKPISMLSLCGLATTVGIAFVSTICHPVMLLTGASAPTSGCLRSGSSSVCSVNTSSDDIAWFSMLCCVEKRAFCESVTDKDSVPACCLLLTLPSSGREFLPHLLCHNRYSVDAPRYYRSCF